MDARIAKTRSRLREAVFEAAAHRPLDELSVSEVAKSAGINRSTFYMHADSPRELLAQFLEEELDEIRRRLMAAIAADPADLTPYRTANDDLLAHLHRHEDLYTAIAQSPSACFILHQRVSRHIRNSFTLMFDSGALSMPPVERFVGGKAHAAAFFGGGITAAIAQWLSTPAPRDDQVLVAVIESLHPALLWADRPAPAEQGAEPPAPPERTPRRPAHPERTP